jgi:hypothetical protein
VTVKLLLVLASTVVLGSETHWNSTNIFYCLMALGAFRLASCIRVCALVFHTYIVCAVVGVWQHCRVEDPPGCVISHVIHDNGSVGRVGNIYKNVVTALLLLMLESVENVILSSSPNNFVVNDQICQQRVGS